VNMPGLLIADDEAPVRSAITSIMARGGLDLGVIVEACNGEEAISLARRMRPSIVLMDVKMPGLDGLEATRTIRAEYPSTRIIILTAYDEFSFAQEALKLGTVDYLLKPVRPATLIEVLSRVQAQIHREERHLREMEKTHSRLQDTLPLAETRLVQDLINGTVGAREFIDRVLGYLGKTICWPAVLVIDIDNFCSAVKGMDSEHLDRFCVLLTDIVRRAMSDPEHTLMGHIRQGVVVAIVSTDRRLTTVDAMRYAPLGIPSALPSNRVRRSPSRLASDTDIPAWNQSTFPTTRLCARSNTSSTWAGIQSSTLTTCA